VPEPISVIGLTQRCERLRKRYGAVVAQSPCFSIDEMEAALDHSRELGAKVEQLTTEVARLRDDR
jgi:hypothetical protein